MVLLRGRNPLGSGLGVSSGTNSRQLSRRHRDQVAIPSVRVSVFRLASGDGAVVQRYVLTSQSPRFGSRCFVASGNRQILHPRPRVAIPSVRVSVFRPSTSCPIPLLPNNIVAIPSVRVSVFRLVLWEPRLGALFEHRVAIPSVRVSVFRREYRFYLDGSKLYVSQSPRFGSRCFVRARDGAQKGSPVANGA